MKTSINHLPELKQRELHQIATVIRSMCDDVEMILCFGSYARGDWKEEHDLEENRKSGHKSDYDILVVTQEKARAHDIELWGEIGESCNELKQSTHARIIPHDIEYLNIKLAEAHYFFSDIKSDSQIKVYHGTSSFLCRFLYDCFYYLHPIAGRAIKFFEIRLKLKIYLLCST